MMTAPNSRCRGSQGGRGRATSTTAWIENPRTVSTPTEFVLHDSAAQSNAELLERQKRSRYSDPSNGLPRHLRSRRHRPYSECPGTSGGYSLREPREAASARLLYKLNLTPVQAVLSPGLRPATRRPRYRRQTEFRSRKLTARAD